VRLVLGPGARDRGARADQISPSLPGVGFVQVDGVREPAVQLRYRRSYSGPCGWVASDADRDRRGRGVRELEQCGVWIGLRPEYVERCVCSPQFKLVCRTLQGGKSGGQHWACSCHLAVALEQLAGCGVVVEVLPA